MTETKTDTMNGVSPPKAEIVPTETKIQIHEFSAKLMDSQVNFHVMRMEDSLYIWIGNDAKLVNLALAMQTKFDVMPFGTAIIGESADSPSTSIAQKLAKRTKKQIFLSYNALTNTALVPLVEQRLVEEMKSRPECF